MSMVLEDHEGTVSIRGRNVTSLLNADSIDGLAGNDQELKNLLRYLNQTSFKVRIVISSEEIKLMANKPEDV